MTTNNNGGPSSHVPAASTHISPSQNTTTASQIESLRRLHCGHQQLPFSEASTQLQALDIDTDMLDGGGSGRLDVRGKRKGNKAVAYEWTADGQALHWCNFITDERGTIFADRRSTFDPAESAWLFAQAETARRKAEADRQALQDQAARQAQDMWRDGVQSGTHAYITSKQLSGLHNARIDAATGALLIPMWVSG